MPNTLRNVRTSELSDDVGLTIHQGNKDVIGPNVGVNETKPITGRFEVKDPIFRKVGRYANNGSFRFGNYATSNNPNNPNYDIWYGDPGNSTPSLVYDNQMTDNLYYGWYPYINNEGNDNWGWPRYYREGSRVYLDGNVKCLRAFNGGSFDNLPIHLNEQGNPEPHQAVIFKVQELYRPKRPYSFIQDIEFSVSNTLHNNTDKFYSNCRIDVIPTGEVKLIYIYYSDGNISEDWGLYYKGIVKNKNIRIHKLNLDNISWPVFTTEGEQIS